MINNPDFVKYVYRLLSRAGFQTIVFGGWAEELTGFSNPRKHNDIDLLYIADDFSDFDNFLSSQSDMKEIKGKRFVHKRAFLIKDIMVELLLVKKSGEKLITEFWGEYILQWPNIDLKPICAKDDGLLITHYSVTNFYREQSKYINQVREKALKN